MKISVLTVCWNSAQTIRYTLDSFFAQEHLAKELVIVDGGSSDETLAIIRSYPQDLVRMICEPDTGMYDALKRGLASIQAMRWAFSIPTIVSMTPRY